MSQENAESSSDMAAAFNHGELDAWLGYWTDETRLPGGRRCSR